MKRRRTSLFQVLSVVGSVLLATKGAVAETNSTKSTCSLCDDHSQPLDPKTRVVLQDSTVTCSYLYDIASSVTDDNECTNLRNIGTTFCGCGAEPPSPCGLCHDGSTLPEPDRVIADDKSCAALESDAMNDFESDCIWWQALMGPLCSCPGEPPALPDDTCLVCPGNVLPNPEKKLQLSSGETVSCIQLQLDANRNSNADCGQFQVLYAESCDCFKDDSTQAPGLAPRSAACGARSDSWKTQATLFLMFLVFGSQTVH